MRIIHVFRGTVGGLFRHVADQVKGQAALGHEVGIFCDSLTGGAAIEAELAKLPLALGLKRLPISILPKLNDRGNTAALAAFAASAKADILHAHGAKGGLYARLVGRRTGLPAVYTPHGGSLHYEWTSPMGAAFLAAEKALRFKGTGFVFVCEFERDSFNTKVGIGGLPHAVAYNGLGAEDFVTRKLSPTAADFFYIGDMRGVKGTDVLIRAHALIPEAERPSLVLVGDGKDAEAYQALVAKLGLTKTTRFLGRKPMTEAMTLGRCMVVPSRRESFPYVVLEAMAAQVPVIATRAGGIPEALPAEFLVDCGDVPALARKLVAAKRDAAAMASRTGTLQALAKAKFSREKMVDDTIAFYLKMLNFPRAAS